MSDLGLKLPEGWVYKPLPELISFIVDNRGRTAPTADKGIPLIATNCISDNSLFPEFLNVRYVSQETYDNWFRSHPKPGDIIFVNKGTPGLVAMVPDPVNFCFAQDMVALRSDDEVVDKEYLLAALRSPYFKDQVENFSVGTTIPHLKKGDFPKLLVPLPPRVIQEQIGRIYYQLSLKIELNRKINYTLEKMAQTLYKYRFVDFGPYQDQPFIDSELGPIPEGWRVGALGSIAKNIKVTIDPTTIDEKTPYIGLGDMPKGSITLDAWGQAGDSISGKFQMKQGQFLFGKLRPYFKKVGIVPVDGICSTDILVIDPKDNAFYGQVLCVLSDQEFIDYTNSVSSGTRMPRANWKEMAKYSVVLPSYKIDQDFSRVVRNWTNIIILNILENRKLAEVRDYLLPRLLSGEISV